MCDNDQHQLTPPGTTHGDPVVYRASRDRKVLSWAYDADANTVQQAMRTARSSIVSGPLALMADAHFGKGATIGSVIPTEAGIIPAAVGVDLGCFVGETKIPLLDGTQSTLKGLTERDKPFWVYAIDPATQRIVPAQATSHKTRDDAELVRIVISGGEDIICTPDHEFMLSDGTWQEAKDLTFNDSLMPLYRKWESRDGYEKASNGFGTARLTHKLVYKAVKGPVPEGHVIHHMNHNHFDNRPENLVAMSPGEHSRLHRMKGRGFDNSDPDFQAARMAGIRKSMENPERLATMKRVGIENITRYMRERPEHFQQVAAEAGKRGGKYLAKFNRTPRGCSDCDHTAKNPAALRWHKHREHATNHKVISVERLNERADVYCLQVPGYNNFALAAGVFVHNCGMTAWRMELTAADLPDTLEPLLEQITVRVPSGLPRRKGYHERTSAWHDKQLVAAAKWLDDNPPPDRRRIPKRTRQKMGNQLGTLGSGNHFVEICLDENDAVWAVLHSGSRGVGNQLAQLHIRQAKEVCAEAGRQLEDRDLAYFQLGDPGYEDYLADMLWSQKYAAANRAIMMRRVIQAVRATIPTRVRIVEKIDCNHNYAQRELHDGREMWITRKGAIRARHGDRGVIPGSMGTSTYIVTGKGSDVSYQSAPHGAGRLMSRGQARRELDIDEFVEQMSGRAWLQHRSQQLIDEAPGAYRDVHTVIEAHHAQVEVDHMLHAVLNYKGI